MNRREQSPEAQCIEYQRDEEQEDEIRGYQGCAEKGTETEKKKLYGVTIPASRQQFQGCDVKHQVQGALRQ